MIEATTENIVPSTAPAAEAIRIDYVPRNGLLKLSIVNFLLGVVTLSVYRFWAKTNVRRHIWSCVHINGEPLEYTGRGMELFKGFRSMAQQTQCLCNTLRKLQVIIARDGLRQTPRALCTDPSNLR